MAYGSAMIGRTGTLLLGILAVFCPIEPACSEVSDPVASTYQVILDRNAFGLKPHLTNAPPPPTNPPPVKLNVQLSGITVDPSGKWAWLVVPPTPGKNTNELYWRLQEGQEQGDLRVLEINARARTVTVLNAGAQATLDFLNNSPAAPTQLAAQPAVGAGGAVPGRGVVRPGVPQPAAGAIRNLPGAPPGAAPGGAPGAGGTASITGPGLSRLTATPTAGGLSVAASPSPTASIGTIPSRTVRTPTAEVIDTSVPVDPAAQWLRMKAEEAAARSQGVQFPPIPPMPGGPPMPGPGGDQ